jgi:hypothetical protein
VPLLQVTRRGSWALLRKLKVEIDGRVVLLLPRGVTVTAQVQSGSHEVVAKMDWARSAPLEVICSDEEATELEVVVPGSLLLAPWRAIFSPGNLFQVRLIHGPGMSA